MYDGQQISSGVRPEKIYVTLRILWLQNPVFKHFIRYSTSVYKKKKKTSHNKSRFFYRKFKKNKT